MRKGYLAYRLQFTTEGSRYENTEQELKRGGSLLTLPPGLCSATFPTQCRISSLGNGTTMSISNHENASQTCPRAT